MKKNQEFEVSGYDHLMCSVPGCQNRWSVSINGDKPKCSMHQWMKPKKEPKDFQFSSPPVKPFVDPEDF